MILLQMPLNGTPPPRTTTATTATTTTTRGSFRFCCYVLATGGREKERVVPSFPLCVCFHFLFANIISFFLFLFFFGGGGDPFENALSHLLYIPGIHTREREKGSLFSPESRVRPSQSPSHTLLLVSLFFHYYYYYYYYYYFFIPALEYGEEDRKERGQPASKIKASSPIQPEDSEFEGGGEIVDVSYRISLHNKRRNRAVPSCPPARWISFVVLAHRPAREIEETFSVFVLFCAAFISSAGEIAKKREIRVIESVKKKKGDKKESRERSIQLYQLLTPTIQCAPTTLTCLLDRNNTTTTTKQKHKEKEATTLIILKLYYFDEAYHHYKWEREVQDIHRECFF
eukprot:gene13445-9256_t